MAYSGLERAGIVLAVSAGAMAISFIGGVLVFSHKSPDPAVSTPKVSVVTPPPAVTLTPAAPSFRYEFVEHRWTKAKGPEDPIKLIRKEDGFCCLVGVGGAFDGGGEEVKVEVNENDGYWYLIGRTLGNNTWARVMEVKIKQAPDVGQ